jgi:hypothetical protein
MEPRHIRSHHRNYNTQDEIDWLSRLGTYRFGPRRIRDQTHRPSDAQPILAQTTLLENYLNVADRRSDWGNIDKRMAIAYASDLLSRLRDPDGGRDNVDFFSEVAKLHSRSRNEIKEDLASHAEGFSPRWRKLPSGADLGGCSGRYVFESYVPDILKAALNV